MAGARKSARLYARASSGDVEAAQAFDVNRRAGNKPMKRKLYRSRSKPFMAYDLETTRIAEGTPRLKYITAFHPDFTLSEPIRAKDGFAHLCQILTEHLLTRDFNGWRFVAWNGNGFDVFFIAMALLQSEDYLIRPYLTRSNAIRGMKVIGLNSKAGLEWEFLDGMAMTGLDAAKMKLEKFVEKFAPQYPKLSLDFSKQEFDPRNREHVRYAERDSEALYYAMQRASEIMKALTGNDLQPTMGNLAIKYFQSKIPPGVVIWKPSQEAREILHGPAKRGGYCWIAKQYVGPVWKYDINQAYAAAMRDARLPCGSSVRTNKFNPDKPGVYLVKLSREKRCRVPFYYRDINTNAGRFTDGREPVETWILSNEIEHLRGDGWSVAVSDGWYWSDSFDMRDMVNELEKLRFTDADGPTGALGTCVKQLGNSSYGKTLEQLGGIELVMSRQKPDGYDQYSVDKRELENVYFKTDEPFPRVYHQPQIGCFITSHVRIVVRNAAIAGGTSFLYADTDCCAFSKPADFLPVDPRKYGMWKQESDGAHHIFIGKKIYMSDDGKHAKGLHVKELTADQFKEWFEGKPPTQMQLQRKNFVKFISGAAMFGMQERSGTDVTKSAQASLVEGEFIPR